MSIEHASSICFHHNYTVYIILIEILFIMHDDKHTYCYHHILHDHPHHTLTNIHHHSHHHHYYIIGAVLPISEEVTLGIAYKRIRCLSKSARNGVPNHTNYIPNLITPMFSYFGFSSTLLNYVNSFFHSTTTKNNKYLTEAEQEEEDLFFDLLDEDRT